MFGFQYKYWSLFFIYFLFSMHEIVALPQTGSPSQQTTLGKEHFISHLQALTPLKNKTTSAPFGNVSFTGTPLFTLSVLPPSHLHGRQIANRFATQTDLVNHISWDAPTSGAAPVSYRIYRDAALSDLIAVIPAEDSLHFNDHNRRKHHTYTYFIVSVNEAGQFSLPIGIQFIGAKTRLIQFNIQAVLIQPENTTIFAGLTQQFSLSVVLNNGAVIQLADTITWTSSDPSIADIDATGLAVGVNAGVALITGTIGSFSATTSLTVLPPFVVEIEISPLDDRVPVFFTKQFQATAIFSDGATEDVTTSVVWSSSNGSVAAIGSNTGLALGLNPGITTITASLPSTSISASTTLTVTPATLATILVIPVNPTIPLGINQQFAAIGVFSDQFVQDLTAQVTWASTNPAVATINSTGLATSLSPGTTSITATLGAIQGVATLNVTTAALVSIAVTPVNPNAVVISTQQFTATGTFTDGSTRDLTNSVTWSSANPAIASIDAAGLAIANSVGSTTITATSGAIQGSTTLSVTAPILTRIEIIPANLMLPIGQQSPYIALGVYNNGVTQDLTDMVTWTSSSMSVATIDRHSGLATTRGAGTTTIRARLDHIIGKVTLTVFPVVLISISIKPSDSVLVANTNEQLTATGTYSDGSTQDITNLVTWSSSDASVAFISSITPTNGLVTAISPGTATISASLDSIVGVALVNVLPAPFTLQLLQINPVNPRIAQGFTQQFQALATYSNGIVNFTQDVTADATWSSSNLNVATIGATTGLATAGLTIGNTTITATFGGLTSNNATLTVNAVALQILVNPAAATIGENLTQQFTATVIYSDGSTEDITQTANWSSTNQGVAIVTTGQSTNNGIAIGLSPGVTSISASQGGVTSAPAVLMVTPPVTLVTISVNPPNSNIPNGMTQQLTATGFFSDGTQKDLTQDVYWSSNPATVATIDTNGLATGVNPGTAVLTATLGTLQGVVQGTAQLGVGPAVLQTITIVPGGQTIFQGLSIPLQAVGQFSDGSVLPLTDVIWTSSDPGIVYIDPTTGIAVGLAGGTVTISATNNNPHIGGEITGSTTLTVDTLLSITVTPSNASLPLYAQLQFTAIGNYANGASLDITTLVDWSSGSGNATIGQNTGLVLNTTGQGAGEQPMITATLNNISGSTQVSIVASSIMGLDIVAVNPLETTNTGVPIVFVGNTVQLQAIGTFNINNVDVQLDVTNSVLWGTTGNTANFATVSASGLVTGVIPTQPFSPPDNTNPTNFITATFPNPNYPGTPVSLQVSLGIFVQSLQLVIVPPAVALQAGAPPQQFAAIGFIDNNAFTQNLTNVVMWSSSDPSVATVSAQGIVTPVSAGTAIITARAQTYAALSVVEVVN